ncbi:MAG TPA: sugar phosphate isomerase/epimerase family protein [Limnochordia bacterium]|nr:sugar phosphate isomerase/epimerase family protein [Limnochordia bacterium]
MADKTVFSLTHYNLGGAPLPDVIAFAADAGFDAIELAITDLWDEKGGEVKADAVAKLLERHQLGVSAVGAANDFVVVDPVEVKRQLTRMERIAELALAVGCRVLRTEGGQKKDAVPEAQWEAAMVECLKGCVPFCERLGVELAVDNHGYVTNDADLQVRVFKAVGSDRVGANCDTMNYRWRGHDLATVGRYYRVIAPFVKHIHLKDGRGSLATYQGTVLGEGEIDLAAAVSALKEAGYAGAWCVEYEGGGDRQEGYRRGLAWMRAHV